MVAIGAFCFGAVFGWAIGFTGWSSRGVAYRVISLVAVVASLTFIQAQQLLLALGGVVSGGLAHEVFLAGLVRRAS
jgi:hypothetical protein